jgi:lipocalin
MFSRRAVEVRVITEVDLYSEPLGKWSQLTILPMEYNKGICRKRIWKYVQRPKTKRKWGLFRSCAYSTHDMYIQWYLITVPTAHYQKKTSSGSGTGSTQPREYNW